MKYTILFLLLPFIGLSQRNIEFEHMKDCVVWYVEASNVLEYRGPVSVVRERVPVEDRKFGRITEIKSVIADGKVLDWRMVRYREKVMWRHLRYPE